MNNIVQKVFIDKDIFFEEQNRNIYLNATKTAREFGKEVKRWLALKETEEYINSVKDYLITEDTLSDFGELVVVRKGGNDKNAQGTWIHKKLIIAFARWLDPKFAVWCDFQIEEILSQKTETISRKEEVESQLVGLDFVFKHLRPSEASKIGMTKTLFGKIGLETSYLPEYSDEEHTFSAKALLEKLEIKISVQQFNKKMISAGLLEIKTRKSSKYRTEKDVDGKEVKIPILKEFKSLTEKGLQFGKNMISPKNQLETQPHYFENKFSELLKIIEI
jgi:ribosomal protein L7/L12